MSQLLAPLPILLAVLALVAPDRAWAQCILANGSFEITGSSGQVFGGWNQFGPVGSSPAATHGFLAARASGPNTGNWDVAGYWQQLTCTPGKRWKATVRAWHAAPKPLAGGSQAILNFEWRNSSGALIGYESHAVVTAATPLGAIQDFSVQSQPAPTGTVAVRLLLGALQGPTDPVPDVFFDQVTLEDLSTPTLAQKQWLDFPGGRTLDFGGRTWRVKGPGFYGPGPNSFSDSPSAVWVDESARLHLTVQKVGNTWYSTEAVLEEPLGYGDYVFTTVGDLDALHHNIVLGLFPWEYGACYDLANGWWNPYNEIDIEFSRWGNPSNSVGQFVAQPYDWPGNIHRFAASFAPGERTTHAMRWLPNRVDFRSWRGGAGDEATGASIQTWTYTGPHIPRPEQPRVHVNLWQFNGPPTTSQEVVIEEFRFVPACLPPCVVDVPGELPAGERLAAAPQAWPNPFRASATIRFGLSHAAEGELAIHDVAGRRVRTLVRGVLPAGEQQVVWDGRDEAGQRVAPGVYFYHLRAGDVSEARRVVYLR